MSAQSGGVEHPHVGWWVAIVGSMAWTGMLGFHDGLYEWWTAAVTAALSQSAIQAIFVAAVITHVAEGLYAARLAQRAGGNAVGWFLQTATLGFPSLRLLRRQAAPGGLGRALEGRAPPDRATR